MKVHPFNFLVSFQVYYSEGLLLRFLLNEIYQNFNSETTINEKKMKSTGRITFFLLRESISLLPQFIPIAIQDIFFILRKRVHR